MKDLANLAIGCHCRNWSAIVATFAMARLAQRIGPLPVSLLCSVIQIGSLVGFLYVRDINGIYALSLLHGIPFIAIVQGYALNLRFLYGPTIAGWRCMKPSA